MKTAFVTASRISTLVILLAFAIPLQAEDVGRDLASKTATPSSKTTGKTNKLLYMYRFFYLPFSVEFREGRTADEILPFVSDGASTRLMSAQEMIQLDGEWKQMRAAIRPKALLLSTPVAVDETVKVTGKMISHKLPLVRSAFDRIAIGDRMMMAKALEGKPDAVKNAFRQLQFLKTFTKGLDQNSFHFFVVSPSWCNSSREYRMLFETYAKRFPQKNVVLHSIVIEDPNEKIFDSRVIGELFPNKEKYSHENVPKFLALENKDGKPTVWEEGQALEQLHNRYFAKHRGHLDSKTSLFGKRALATGADASKLLDPRLSSATK